MKRFIFCALFAAACAALLPLRADSPSRSPWNVTEHVKLEDFIIQSHRGAGGLSTDNTMEAFELGWKMGTYPEADVRTSKDGVLVAFHDADFKRVVKDADEALLQKKVADLTHDELAKLDVGSWKGAEFSGHRVPKISDVLARMTGQPARHLYLDIKDADLAKLAAEVKEAGVSRQVILASPKHELIQEWKKLVPESGALIWIPGTEADKRKRIEALRAADFAGLTQVQVHVQLPQDAKDLQPGEPFSPSRKFLIDLSQELAAKGILFQTLPWKAGRPEVYHQLLDLGLASFATDHPEVTKSAVKEYYQRRGK